MLRPSLSASSLSSAELKAAHQRRASLSATSLSSAELKAAHQRRASLTASSLTTAELKAAHRLRQYYRMAAEGGQEQAEAALGEAQKNATSWYCTDVTGDQLDNGGELY